MSVALNLLGRKPSLHINNIINIINMCKKSVHVVGIHEILRKGGTLCLIVPLHVLCMSYDNRSHDGNGSHNNIGT